MQDWPGVLRVVFALMLIFEKPVLALGALPALILFFVSIGSRRFQANRQEIWRQRQEQMEKDHHGLVHAPEGREGDGSGAQI